MRADERCDAICSLHLDARRDVTVGHLLLACDAPTGVLARGESGEDTELACAIRRTAFTVPAAASPSGQQGCAPFEEHELTGRGTFRRGASRP